MHRHYGKVYLYNNCLMFSYTYTLLTHASQRAELGEAIYGPSGRVIPGRYHPCRSSSGGESHPSALTEPDVPACSWSTRSATLRMAPMRPTCSSMSSTSAIAAAARCSSRPINRWPSGDRVLHDEDLAQAIVDRVLERGRLWRSTGRPTGRST